MRIPNLLRIASQEASHNRFKRLCSLLHTPKPISSNISEGELLRHPMSTCRRCEATSLVIRPSPAHSFIPNTRARLCVLQRSPKPGTPGRNLTVSLAKTNLVLMIIGLENLYIYIEGIAAS
jgi:hypothetical protein